MATYESLVREPDATSKRANKWMFVSALVATLLYFALSALVTPALSAVLGYGPSAAVAPFGGSVLVTILASICAAPFVGIVGMGGLALWAGITQWIATRLGGIGTYPKLVYAFSSIAAPLAPITIVLSSIPTSTI